MKALYVFLSAKQTAKIPVDVAVAEMCGIPGMVTVLDPAGNVDVLYMGTNPECGTLVNTEMKEPNRVGFFGPSFLARKNSPQKQTMNNWKKNINNYLQPFVNTTSKAGQSLKRSLSLKWLSIRELLIEWKREEI